jgi:hypothetical protein
MSASAPQNDPQGVSPEEEAVRRATFSFIEKFGPRDLVELTGRSFTSRKLVVVVFKTMILVMPVIGVSLLGLVIMGQLHDVFPSTIWTFAFGAGAVINGLIIPLIVIGQLIGIAWVRLRDSHDLQDVRSWIRPAEKVSISRGRT